MVSSLKSGTEIYNATQNGSSTIIYFSRGSSNYCKAYDMELSALESKYPQFYFYKVDVDNFENWSGFAAKNNIIGVPTFSYYNQFQYASFYAFSPANKTMLDILIEIDDEDDDLASLTDESIHTTDEEYDDYVNCTFIE